MKFFERMRQRSADRNEAARQEAQAAWGRLQESQRSLAQSKQRLEATLTFHANTLEQQRELARLEVELELLSTLRDSAKRRYTHALKTASAQAELRELRGKIAKLTGEQPPPPDDSDKQIVSEARTRYEHAEAEHAALAKRVETLRQEIERQRP